MKKDYKFEEAAAAAGRAISKAINKGQPVYIVMGTVEAVDEEAKTINAVVDDIRLFSDISLDIVPNGDNSVYFLPAVGSVVMLGFVEGYEEMPFVLKTTKIDKVLISNNQEEESSIYFDNEYVEIIRGSSIWRLENGKVSLDSDLFEMNGGQNGGILKIVEMLEAINSNVSRFNSHTHSGVVVRVVGDASGIMGNSGAPTSNQSAINRSDVEDTKVTH